MIKAVIILKNGSEIAIQTDVLDVQRDRRGNVKRIELNDTRAFMRYLKLSEIACVLAYPAEEPKEVTPNGA